MIRPYWFQSAALSVAVLSMPARALASGFDGLGAALTGVFLAIPFDIALLILVIVAAGMAKRPTGSSTRRGYAWTTIVLGALLPCIYFSSAIKLEGSVAGAAAGVMGFFGLPLGVLGILAIVFGLRVLKTHPKK